MNIEYHIPRNGTANQDNPDVKRTLECRTPRQRTRAKEETQKVDCDNECQRNILSIADTAERRISVALFRHVQLPNEIDSTRISYLSLSNFPSIHPLN